MNLLKPNPDYSETLWNEAKQQSQTIFITSALSLDEDIVQQSPLISRRKYFVKFPVNLLKPNPQSEASILSSVHLTWEHQSRKSNFHIFQTTSSEVAMAMASYFVVRIDQKEKLLPKHWCLIAVFETTSFKSEVIIWRNHIQHRW